MLFHCMKKCVAMGAVAIILSMASVHVSAQCTKAQDLDVDAQGLSLLNALVNNTNNTALATAWHDKKCQITKPPHGGGTPCPSNLRAKSHVTVKNQENGQTCHVFDVDVKSGRDTLKCTTCK